MNELFVTVLINSIFLCALLAGLEEAELSWEKVMSCTSVHQSGFSNT